jgi:methyltransferase-like protein
LDFLSNQAFRRALLCRREIELNQELQPEAIALLHVASSAQPASGAVSIFSVAPDFFRRSDGATVSVNEPLVKAALVHLAEQWPQSVPFDTLCARARGQLGSARAQDSAAPSHDVQTLTRGLLRCYLANLVELHVLAVPCAPRPAERPVANGLARYQAAFGPRVTNLRHEVIVLDDLQRQLLQLLDGSRDRADLAQLLTNLVVERAIPLTANVFPNDANQVRKFLDSCIDQHLAKLAQWSLLQD